MSQNCILFKQYNEALLTLITLILFPLSSYSFKNITLKTYIY